MCIFFLLKRPWHSGVNRFSKLALAVEFINEPLRPMKCISELMRRITVQIVSVVLSKPMFPSHYS